MASEKKMESIENLKRRFAHISEFFEFVSFCQRSDGVTEFTFKCCLCIKKDPKKSSNSSPYSNLKTHLKRMHPHSYSKCYRWRK